MTGAKFGLHRSDEFAPAAGVPEPAGQGRQIWSEREAALKVFGGHCWSGAPFGQ
jgi:hypothetical protein